MPHASLRAGIPLATTSTVTKVTIATLILVAATNPAGAQTCDGVPTMRAHRNDGLGALVQLFTDESPARGVDPAHSLDRTTELQRTRNYINACIDSHSGHTLFYQPVTARHTVCCEPDDIQTGSGPYLLKVHNGKLRLRKGLVLLYQGDPEEEARVREHVEEVREILVHIFAQHGIELDLQLQFAGGFTTQLPLEWASLAFLHEVITVYDEVPRGQIRPWSNQWIFPDWMPDHIAYGRIAHEFSHTVGMPDTYSSNADCRLRKALEPGYIVTSGTQLEYADDGELLNFFAAEHIFALLEPMCGRPD